MMVPLVRIARFAVQNFWRDIWLSSVTIVIFVLSITLVGVLSGVKVITDQAITVLRQKADLVVTFKPGTSETTVLDLQARLEELPETKSVDYLSADENLERFRLLHADDPTIKRGTDVVGQNPFGPSLTIEAKLLEDYPIIVRILDDQQYADLIESGTRTLESNRLAIAKLTGFTQNLARFSIALTLVFSVIAVLVVVNTMRIAMYSHREEIGIMKLVGASNWFVRGPFLVESVLTGAAAAVLASGLLLLGITLLSGWFNTFFGDFQVDLAAYLTRNFIAIFWPPLVGAVLLSVISAGIAVGRYLRV